MHRTLVVVLSLSIKCNRFGTHKEKFCHLQAENAARWYSNLCISHFVPVPLESASCPRTVLSGAAALEMMLEEVPWGSVDSSRTGFITCLLETTLGKPSYSVPTWELYYLWEAFSSTSQAGFDTEIFALHLSSASTSVNYVQAQQRLYSRSTLREVRCEVQNILLGLSYFHSFLQETVSWNHHRNCYLKLANFILFEVSCTAVELMGCHLAASVTEICFHSHLSS